MDELIAFFNKLSIFFAFLLADAGKLYPEGRLPRRPALLIHSSLSSFGSVPGGAGTVATALSSTCERNHITLVMPAHTNAQEEAIPGEAGIFSGQIPVLYDRHTSNCGQMGRISEYFRTMPGVRRSDHPILSFWAAGPDARRILREHRCETGLGPASPTGTLYKNDALVLMLGTGWETCTVMHLAEYIAAEKIRAEGKRPDMVTCMAYVRHGRTGCKQKVWEDIAFHPENFPTLGIAFENEHPEKILRGPIPICGTAPGRDYRLMRVRDIVGFCVDRYRDLQ